MNKAIQTALSAYTALTLTAFGAAAFSVNQMAFADGNSEGAEASSSASSANGLSQSQIKERLKEINARYEVGEEFSADDAQFVKTYAAPATQPAIMTVDSNSTFNKTKTYGKTTVNASGSLFHKGTFAYIYGGNVKVTTKSETTPKKIKIVIHCTSYGVVGSGGVGKIYDGKVKAAKENSKKFSTDLRGSYSGVAVTYDVDCSVKITTSAGNVFTISNDD